MKNNWKTENNIFRDVKLDVERGKFSHAYLFVTEDVFAITEICKKIACLTCCKGEDAPCEKCGPCIKIDSEVFADVCILGKNQKIVVDDINNLTNNAYVAPFEADKKIYILLNVDDMTEEASNKLLKTLEEPPKNVHFLLCAKNEFALLQTIKSRTQKMYLAPFAVDEVENELESLGVQSETAKIVASQCDGNLTKAMLLAKDKNYTEMFELVKDMFFNLNDTKNIATYCFKLLNFKNNFDEILNLVSSLAIDALYAKLQLFQFVSFKQFEQQFLAQNDFSKIALLKLLQKIIDLKRKNFYNVNVVELIDELVFYLVEVKVKCKE